jgi:hypothetical protein
MILHPPDGDIAGFNVAIDLGLKATFAFSCSASMSRFRDNEWKSGERTEALAGTRTETCSLSDRSRNQAAAVP